MNKSFLAFTYAWIFIVGAFMFIFTPEGIIRVCIACGSVLTNIIGVVSMAIGAVGFGRTVRSGVAG
jgi:hypothetical protein